MTEARRLLVHPWLTVRAQIALGLFFVIAALPKIVDPPGFAHMVYNYRLVPGTLLNLMALVMPWLELLCGLALVLGVWRRAATTLIGILLAVFIGAIGINLARGNAIDCGCFDPTPIPKTRDQRPEDMYLVIFRDLGMLLMVAQLWWASWRERVAVAETA